MTTYTQEKSRNKNVYVFERELNSIRCFEFNNQNFKFETLCEHLDPINNYLTHVSKNAIVNVAFFDLVKKRLLKYNGSAGETNEFMTIKISDKERGDLFLKHFTAVKNAYTRRILLQKTILGYEKDIGL